MKIGFLKETANLERRVAVISEHGKLISKDNELWIEESFSSSLGVSDETYLSMGFLVHDRKFILKNADLIVSINPPEKDDIREENFYVSILDPFFNLELIKTFIAKKSSVFALDMIPRITRAQSMDILSSMSSIAGYKAVLEAAATLPKYFPMLMTAAGTVSPAKVLVLGAGVAGLQAIATAKRLGASVSAYDIRPVVKEQVESLGAKFVELGEKNENAETKGGYAKEQTPEELKKQQEELEQIIIEQDVVITTALIPGRKAPLLIKKEVVDKMKPGSVIVDLATEKGGNVEGSKKDEIVGTNNGVKIVGFSDFPSRTYKDGSTLISKNICTFIQEIISTGEINLDLDNEIINATLLIYKGEVRNEKLKELIK